MGHGKYIDPFAGRSFVTDVPQDDNCHSERPVCHSERSEESPVYRVQAGEVLNLQFVVLPGQSRDIDVNIDLIGPGAEAHIKALYLCGADEKVNFHILMHHRAPGCHSTQSIKGLAGGTAQVQFHGVIVVAPEAQQTEAYQENHNIVLTDQARVETRPQLEIYADDVKCSHGATVGQLNDEELFYMRSRGIPEAEAKTLQMLSFLSPVIPEGREQEIETLCRHLGK